MASHIYRPLVVKLSQIHKVVEVFLFTYRKKWEILVLRTLTVNHRALLEWTGKNKTKASKGLKSLPELIRRTVRSLVLCFRSKHGWTFKNIKRQQACVTVTHKGIKNKRSFWLRAAQQMSGFRRYQYLVGGGWVEFVLESGNGWTLWCY